ncbi:MAG: TadE family protein [Nitrospirales bacterium]
MKIPRRRDDGTQKGCWNQRGSTAVEVALLIGPFLLLLVGIMEFGLYYFHQHTLQFATREGMRLATVGRQLLDENGEPMDRTASIIKTIKDKASVAMEIDDSNIKIFKVGDNYQNPDDWEEADPSAGNPADYMRVQVTYDHEFATSLIGGFFGQGNTITMEARGTYRNEL